MMMSVSLARSIVVLVAFAVLAAWAPAARAQSAVTVVVLDSVSGIPVRGALVALRPPGAPASAAAVAEQLSGAGGRTAFPGVAPGRYVVRVRRVGYQPYTSPALHLAAAPVELRVPSRRVTLPVMTVVADRRCRAGFGRASSALALWTEVQTTLASAALVAEDSAQRVPVAITERYLDEDGEPLYAEPPVPTTAMPVFRSESPATLSLHGYAASEAYRRSWTFHAPSVEVLRSEEFEGDHCFRVVSGGAGADSTAGLLGIAFEPRRDRRVAEIAGTMWVDTATSALRRVTFRYVNTDIPGGGRFAGGDLRIGLLPSGAWGVRHWELRLPRLTGTTTRTMQHWRIAFRPVPADGAFYLVMGAAIAADSATGAALPTSATGIDAVVLPTGMDCDALGAPACLRHAHDYTIGAGFSRDLRRANAYYLGACRAGPSERLRLATLGRTSATPVDTAAIERVVRSLQEELKDPYGTREDDLSAAQRAEYDREAQLDGCARLALSLLSDASASAAHEHAALVLAAACDEIEPIACSTLGLLAAARATSAADSAVAAGLFERGCVGRHAEGCRWLFELRPQLDPESLRLRTGRRALGGGTAASLLATAVHERLGADARGLSPGAGRFAADAELLRRALPFADVEAFPNGILVRVWTERPVRGFATPLDPLGPDLFAALARALDQLPERRVRLVMHMDSLPTGSFFGRLQTSQQLTRHAAGWEEHLDRLGVSRRRIEVDIRGYDDPIAWNGTFLGREQNRRVEIIVH